MICGLLLSLQQAAVAAVSMEYYHYNHQGSLLEVYDGTNHKRLLSQAWSPWGERHILHAATSVNGNNVASLLASGLPAHRGYTGHTELLATNLVFAGDTRLYDARLKRFLNSDDRTTGAVRGQNRYSYAYNDPMTYIDPDGRAAVLPERLGGDYYRLTLPRDNESNERRARIGQMVYDFFTSGVSNMDNMRRQQRAGTSIAARVLNTAIRFNERYGYHMMTTGPMVSTLMGLGAVATGLTMGSRTAISYGASLAATGVFNLNHPSLFNTGSGVVLNTLSSFLAASIKTGSLLSLSPDSEQAIDPILITGGIGMWGGISLLASRYFLAQEYSGSLRNIIVGGHHGKKDAIKLGLAFPTFIATLATAAHFGNRYIAQGTGVSLDQYTSATALYTLGILPLALRSAFYYGVNEWDNVNLQTLGNTAAACTMAYIVAACGISMM